MQDELLHAAIVATFIIANFLAAYHVYKGIIDDYLKNTGYQFSKEITVALTYMTSLPGNIIFESKKHSLEASSEIRFYFAYHYPKITTGFCIYHSLKEDFKNFAINTVLDIVTTALPLGLDLAFIAAIEAYRTGINRYTVSETLLGVAVFSGRTAIEKSGERVLKKISERIIARQIITRAASFMKVGGPVGIVAAVVVVTVFNVFYYFYGYYERLMDWEKNCKADTELEFVEETSNDIPVFGYPIQMLPSNKCMALFQNFGDLDTSNYIDTIYDVNNWIIENSPDNYWTGNEICIRYHEKHKFDDIFISDTIPNTGPIPGTSSYCKPIRSLNSYRKDMVICKILNEKLKEQVGILLPSDLPVARLYLRHFPESDDPKKYYNNLGYYSINYSIMKIENQGARDIIMFDFIAVTKDYSEEHS